MKVQLAKSRPRRVTIEEALISYLSWAWHRHQKEIAVSKLSWRRLFYYFDEFLKENDEL